MSPRKIVSIPLEKIDPPEEMQRDMIDPQKIIELAESIREKGLQEPILVRPMNGRYEIVYGHRRYLAHKHLGVEKIEAFIKDMNDVETILIRAIENLQRENLSPMEEARTYHLMKTKGGMSVKEVCRKTGKQYNTVIRYLRLWDMPKEFQEAVEKKGLALNVADKLMEIDDPTMRLYYLNMASDNGITGKVAELWVSDYLKSRQGTLFEEGGGNRGVTVESESKPSYMTCEVCFNPVEIHKTRSMLVCPDCVKSIKGSKNVKPSMG